MKESVTFAKWIENLSEGLKENLPGPTCHKKLMPATRKTELSKPPVKIPRKSAVLLFFYPINEMPHFVLIKRAMDGGVHSSQIALPGGQYEEKDKTLQQTALRESYEEIGVQMNDVTVIGALSKLYIPPSNFEVYPFVGYVLKRPFFNPNEEVEKVLEVEVSRLIHPETFQMRKLLYRTGNEIEVPCYYLNNEIVWGATAMILSELIEIGEDSVGFEELED